MRISENFALIISSVSFFAFLFLFMTLLSMFVYVPLINILIATFIGSACSVFVFWFLTETIIMKKHQVYLARFCLLLAVILQIGFLVYTGIEQDSSFVMLMMVSLMKIGLYSFLYYFFLKLSFDFFGAVVRRRLVEQTD